jgi:hypothetical protein
MNFLDIDNNKKGNNNKEFINRASRKRTSGKA